MSPYKTYPESVDMRSRFAGGLFGVGRVYWDSRYFFPVHQVLLRAVYYELANCHLSLGVYLSATLTFCIRLHPTSTNSKYQPVYSLSCSPVSHCCNVILYKAGGGGIGYQVADTGPVGWVNFWPGCSLVPKY